MSGGAFEYAYHDAKEFAGKLQRMADRAERYDYPEPIVEQLQELQADVEECSEYLRTIEWVASGDYGTEKLDDVVEEWADR